MPLTVTLAPDRLSLTLLAVLVACQLARLLVAVLRFNALGIAERRPGCSHCGKDDQTSCEPRKVR